MSSGDGDGRAGGIQAGSGNPLLQEEGGGASAEAGFADSENPQGEEKHSQRSHGEARLLLLLSV